MKVMVKTKQREEHETPLGRLTKVRINVSIAGVNFSYQPGQVALIESGLAAKWVAVGHAELVDADTPVGEAAVLETNEFAMHDPIAYYRSLGVPVSEFKE